MVDLNIEGTGLWKPAWNYGTGPGGGGWLFLAVFIPIPGLRFLPPLPRP